MWAYLKHPVATNQQPSNAVHFSFWALCILSMVSSVNASIGGAMGTACPARARRPRLSIGGMRSWMLHPSCPLLLSHLSEARARTGAFVDGECKKASKSTFSGAHPRSLSLINCRSSSAVVRALSTVLFSALVIKRWQSLVHAWCHSACNDAVMEPDGARAPNRIITPVRASTLAVIASGASDGLARNRTPERFRPDAMAFGFPRVSRKMAGAIDGLGFGRSSITCATVARRVTTCSALMRSHSCATACPAPAMASSWDAHLYAKSASSSKPFSNLHAKTRSRAAVSSAVTAAHLAGPTCEGGGLWLLDEGPDATGKGGFLSSLPQLTTCCCWSAKAPTINKAPTFSPRRDELHDGLGNFTSTLGWPQRWGCAANSFPCCHFRAAKDFPKHWATLCQRVRNAVKAHSFHAIATNVPGGITTHDASPWQQELRVGIQPRQHRSVCPAPTAGQCLWPRRSWHWEWVHPGNGTQLPCPPCLIDLANRGASRESRSSR